jgi:hypothetical protein
VRTLRDRIRIRRVPDRRWLAALGLGLTAILVLSMVARPLERYWQNYALNTAADLIGAVFTLFVITPIIERAGEARVREHSELDYSRFLDRASRSSNVLRVLDTYSNLLIEPHAGRFETVVQEAIARGVSVRILLINPTTLAAEQRALELGQADDLRPRLYRNLATLDRLRRSFDSYGGPGGRGSGTEFEVRLYSSGPDVTMYRWDDRVLVSFYPVGKVSGQTSQLEVSVDSPLGGFVNARFHEVWRTAAPFQALIPVTLVDGRVERTYLVRYVELDGVRYVTSARIERFVGNAHGPVAISHAGGDCYLHEVERDASGLTERLDAEFRGIYGELPDTPYRLMELA